MVSLADARLLCNVLNCIRSHLVQGHSVVMQDRWVHHGDVEGKRLEEGDSILTAHLFQNHSEFVIRDLIYEVTLELDNDVVTSEHRAECVALAAKEAEPVTFHDDWVVETSFNRGLCRHDGEVGHVLKSLVPNLNGKGEGLGLGVDLCRAYLLELNLRLQLLNSLLNEWVVLVEHIKHELWSVQSETVGRWVISTQLWRDGWDAGGCQNPIRGLTWRCVAKQLVGSANFKSIRRVSLRQDLLKQGELHRVSILNQVTG